MNYRQVTIEITMDEDDANDIQQAIGVCMGEGVEPGCIMQDIVKKFKEEMAMYEYSKYIEDDDDVYDIVEFEEDVAFSNFIDDDGIGSFAKDGKYMSATFCPSQFKEMKPEDATHVVWFNK